MSPGGFFSEEGAGHPVSVENLKIQQSKMGQDPERLSFQRTAVTEGRGLLGRRGSGALGP